MIHFRPGSQVFRLVTLLSVVGEFPMRSLALLGNARTFRTLVHRLIKPQLFRDSQTGAEIECRLLTVCHTGNQKSVRLYKAALPILEWMGAKDYYLGAFWDHHFPGDAAHCTRNHRVAEAVVMCLRAGMEIRPYVLPKLQNLSIRSVVPEYPALYLARDLKKVGETEMNKTIFTRMIGAFLAGGNCFAVYNTRSAVMKWSGMGEFKALHSLTEVMRLNAGLSSVDSAVLLGESEETALQTLMESDRSRRMEFRFDSIYRHVYFVPLNDEGVRQLRLMLLPDWNEKLLAALFPAETRSYNRGQFEYDARIGEKYIFSHLDGDIARLERLRDAIRTGIVDLEVICFPHQTHFLREYLGGKVETKEIELSLIETALGLKGGNFSEE